MQDLAGKFVSNYYSDLRKSDPHPKTFAAFSRTVESTLQKFSGIPGLARRYHTALLPAEGLAGVKKCLTKVEDGPGVLRGAVLTPDGYIVISNLRAYELEDVLDLIESPQKSANGVGRIKSHPGLEKNTSFFIVNIPKKAVCAFVVKGDESNSDLSDMAKDLVDHVRTTSFEGIKKVEPSRSEAPMAFYDHDVPQTLRPMSDIMNELKALFPDLDNRTFGYLKEVLGKLDGDTTISELHELTGFTRAQIDEALAHLIAKGAIQIVRLYPKLGKRDKRFAAFLEVVGISTRDYKVLDTIWEHCTGSLSVKDISKKTGISVSKILDVLRSLGSQVTWKKMAGASR
jgi:hypothetical protein